jgi:actin-related protein
VKDARSVLIIDLGTGYLKCGSRQLRRPKILPACFQDAAGKAGNPTLLALDPGRAEWCFPLENGTIPKTDALLPLCEQVLRQFPQESANHRNLELVLLLFPFVNTERAADLSVELQEALGCAQVRTAIQQVLVWGYWGMETSLIVDVGYSTSFVTPIYRGFLLDDVAVPVTAGSFFVSAALRRLLLTAAEGASAPKSTQYTRLAEDSHAIDYMKANLCHVLSTSEEGLAVPVAQPRYRHGTVEVGLGDIPWEATEVLFQPDLLEVGEKGLSDAVADVLGQVDSTVRAELAANILLAGGGSDFPGLRLRLENDLRKRLPHLAIKVFSLENPIYSAWLGAATS